MTVAAPANPLIQFDRSQRRMFEDPSRVIVVNWHRQKGKDFTAAGKAVDSGLRTGQDWFIVSLTQRQADATFIKCKKFVEAYKRMLRIIGEVRYDEREYIEYDKSIDHRFVCKTREIILPNGARVVSLPGRDPDTLAGLTGNIIFTEFGLFPNGGYAHWSVIFPIATRGYQIVVISTPRGKNTKFYELWTDKETYSVHTCDIYQSVEQEGFILRDNNGRPTTIEAFRRLYNDESKWPREYGCQFTGDLESLVKWAQLEEAAALSAGDDFKFLRIEGEKGFEENFFQRDYADGSKLFCGWDVARTNHLSSFAVNRKKHGQPARLRYLVLMVNSPFALQRRIVQAGMNSGFSCGCGDSTGLGMDSNETLCSIYGERWEAVNFGGSRKRELASALATGFSDRDQTIPPLDGPYKFIATDIYAIQKDESGGQLAIDETGNPLLPESHCDIGWSVALARRAGTRNPQMPLPPPAAQKPFGW